MVLIHSIRSQQGLCQSVAVSSVLPEVKQMTGLSKSTIYARIASGTFPSKSPLGPRVVAWSEHAVKTWIQSQIDAAA